MKKLLIILLLIAIGVGAYFATQKGGNEVATESSETLSYVPADTIFYMGSVEAMSVQDVQEKLAKMNQANWFSYEDMINDFDQKDVQPGIIMGLSILSELAKFQQQPVEQAPRLGIGDTVDSAVYTVGLLPVVRMSLADAAKFDGVLNAIEKERNISADTAEVSGVKIRRYALSAEDELFLVVSTANNQLVLTVDTPMANDQDLAPALGVTKPDASLAEGDMLDKIMDQYGFEKFWLAFIDHQALAKTLTQPESGLAAQQLSSLFAGGENPLAAIQTEACQKDLQDMMKVVPRTVMGYTSLDSDKATMYGLTEVQSNSATKQMRDLRGHIPASHMQKEGIITLALGVDIAKVMPAIQSAATHFTQAAFTCEPLVEMQAKMQENMGSLAMMGMTAGMLNGFQGVAFTLFEIEADENAAQPQRVDAAVTISAEDPKTLLMAASNFFPPLQQVQLEEGKLTDLPLPSPVPMKALLNGHQLTIMTGPKAESSHAKPAEKTELEKNGFFYEYVDMGQFGKFFEMIQNVQGQQMDPEAQAEMEKAQQQFKKMENVKVSIELDFSEKGVEQKAEMTF